MSFGSTDIGGLMTVALVIGHKPSSKGAYNYTYDTYEFDFNHNLAEAIVNKVTGVKLYYRNSYTKLPFEINADNPEFVVSMHCNAFNRTATGTEVLYYHKSTKGKKLAEILQKNFIVALCLKDREIKSRTT